MEFFLLFSDVLYRVAMGIPVSVGHLMHASMCKCARKGKNNLALPQIITALCVQAGVPVEEGDSFPKILTSSFYWSWSDIVVDAQRVAYMALGRARASEVRRGRSESEEEFDCEPAQDGKPQDVPLVCWRR